MADIDSNRNVYCLMGLPIDAVSMVEAIEKVRAAAFSGQRCFISTPNLNFAMAAIEDDRFRDSVLHSDLSLADGMPLVWVARLLGLPIRERVSGAGLFEQLMAHGGEPVTVYFFGGPQGAAEAASRAVNAAGGGLRCVGFESPGFGSLEDMSTEACIQRINASGAMFVIVSLGAKKGQQWIEMNRHRLRAPVLCHLGAVVNFAAGSVRRAPGWVQALGAEWLWRIVQEPGLWRRYWSDGRSFLKVMLLNVLPLVWRRVLRLLGHAQPAGTMALRRGGGRVELALVGDWGAEDRSGVRAAFGDLGGPHDELVVDLAATTHIGSACLGALLQAHAAHGDGKGMRVLNASRSVAATIRRYGASYLLHPTPTSVVPLERQVG